MLNSQSISSTEEKRIVTGMIVSTEFVEAINPIFSLDYFKNSYLKTVAEWCSVFFEEYTKAPFMHIKDIFESESHYLDENDVEMIEILLGDLDDKYDEGEINLGYWVDNAKDYFRVRELEITVNNISVLKEKGDIEEAEAEIEKFKKVTLEIDQGVLINPGDMEVQERIYEKREKEDKNFFQLPGDLGKYLGNQKRGDVVAYYGPAKRGKCISGDSLIYLSDGTLKTIKEIVHSKISNILSMDANHKIVKGKVTNWIQSGNKQEYVLKSKSGRTIKTSKDHKFYTPDGWKNLSELKKGDCLALGKKINIDNKGNNLSVVKIKILAYLIADGYLGKRVSFTKYDPTIMGNFISHIKACGDTYIYDPKVKEKAIWLHKGEVTKLLDQEGLRNKLSGDKFIPDSVLRSDDNTLSEFLNTLFTCDGSIWKDRGSINIEYSSKSKVLINQILFCLSRFGIIGKIQEVKVKGVKYYLILISSNAGIISFMKYIGFTFAKQEKALVLCKDLIPVRDYIDIIPHKFVNDYARVNGCKGNETFRTSYAKKKDCSRFTFTKVVGQDHPILNTDLLWDRVVSIKKGKIVPMYDLTAKDNHNFIANSFVVHNSFTLINQWKHGVISKRKTLFWSIEMTDTECLPRINKTFYPMINKEPGEYKFPVFDCVHNQTGDCVEGLSPAILYEDGEFVDDPTHVPCTKCRKHSDHKESIRYEMAVYQDKIYRDQDDIFTIRKQHPKYRKMMNRYGRLSIHPKYTLTYDKMMRDLDVFWRTEKWFPDILIIDYIDILIHSNFDDYRADDEKWKLLAKIAGETNTLVITGTQANKAGHTTDILDATHQGGFYGKNRHVNLMVGLNQSSEDKARGVMNFGITEARDKEYIPGQTCTCLQDFSTGQAYLDSFYAYN